MNTVVDRDYYQKIIAEKDIRIQELQEDLQTVLLQLRELKRHVFGRKSEKLQSTFPNQQQLFEEALPEIETPEESTSVASYKCSKRNGRKPLSKDIPRERIEYMPEETHCSNCGESLQRIGEDITEELDYVPASFVVREHVRIKCACPQCKNEVVTGELPAGVQVVEKGRPGAGLLAHIAVSKYCMHSPCIDRSRSMQDKEFFFQEVRCVTG